MKAKYQFFKTTPLPGEEEEKTMYHVRNTSNSKISFDELCRDLADRSTVTSADSSGAMIGIVQILTSRLRDGHTVEIKGLGYFKAHPSCEPISDPSKIRSENIHFGKVSFKPCKSLLDNLKTMPFTRDQEYRKPMKYDDTERKERILNYIDNKGYIRSSICMALNGCSRYMALKDIDQLKKEGKIEQIGTKKNGIYTAIK